MLPLVLVLKIAGSVLTQAQIVVFGRDPLLMDTRLLVLQSAGYKGLGVASIADLAPTLCTNIVDLILLCHSLSMDEARSAIDIVTLVTPATPILRLTRFHWLERIKNEVIVDASEGPQRLLKEVRALIKSGDLELV